MRIIIFLIISANCFAQFPIQNLTKVPTYTIAGQSNATNLWLSSIYNTGSTVRHGKNLDTLLMAYYGVDEVLDYSYGADGKALFKNPIDDDWNVESNEIYYDHIYNIGNSLSNSFYPDPGLMRNQGKLCDFKFILWLQGESDASNTQGSLDYEINLKKLINKFRDDYKNQNLPFIIVRLNPNINRLPSLLTNIRNAMDNIAAELNNVFIIDIDDFVSSDFASPGISTNVHYSVQGLDKLVTRIYNVVVLNNL